MTRQTWRRVCVYLLQLLRLQAFTATATRPGRPWGAASWWRSSSSRPWHCLCGSANRARGRGSSADTHWVKQTTIEPISFSYWSDLIERWTGECDSWNWGSSREKICAETVSWCDREECLPSLTICGTLAWLVPAWRCVLSSVEISTISRVEAAGMLPWRRPRHQMCLYRPQPPPSVWGDSSQQRLCSQAGWQGGREGESCGRRWAVDPGRGGQLQPFHQQVRTRTQRPNVKVTTREIIQLLFFSSQIRGGWHRWRRQRVSSSVFLTQSAPLHQLLLIVCHFLRVPSRCTCVRNQEPDVSVFESGPLLTGPPRHREHPKHPDSSCIDLLRALRLLTWWQLDMQLSYRYNI